MEAIKYSLGIYDQRENEGDEMDGNEETREENILWKGKTLYELFHGNHIIIRRATNEKKNNIVDEPQSTEDNTRYPSSSAMTDPKESLNGRENIIVQLCMIDHNITYEGTGKATPFGISSFMTESEPRSKETLKNMQNKVSVAVEFESKSTSAMRALEREDSSSTDDKNTTIVYVPNMNDTSCDKKGNADTTLCDAELDSLEINPSFILTADEEIKHPQQGNDSVQNDSMVCHTKQGTVNVQLRDTGFDLDGSKISSSQENPDEEKPCTSSEIKQQNNNACGSEGEQSRHNNNIASGDNEISDAEYITVTSQAAFVQSSHQPNTSNQGANHQLQTCTKAPFFPPPRNSSNDTIALKCHSRDHRECSESNDIIFGENNFSNFFPKRKISSIDDLIEEGHPFMFALCYLLACLANITGIDFVTVLGILLTLISMISMIFI
jgi:hypothetical protein